MELIEYIHLTASILEILGATASLLRWAGKKRQAEVVEKIIRKIESKKKPTEKDARSITQRVLQEELNEKEAKEVLGIISILEKLFPVRPKGKVLEFGPALRELIWASVNALGRFKVFELFGEKKDIWYHLEVMTFASKLYEILRNKLKGGFWKGYILSAGVGGHPYLRDVPFYLQHSDTGNKAYISFEDDCPYSFFLADEKGTETEVRLDHYKLKFLREGLMSDVRHYIEKTSKEYEKSKQEAKKIEEALTALRQLSAKK